MFNYLLSMIILVFIIKTMFKDLDIVKLITLELRLIIFFFFSNNEKLLHKIGIFFNKNFDEFLVTCFFFQIMFK